ncbi:MAG: ATP-binding cassette domain-containing protein [Bacilli bacterium]|nr:ATP-binding cassette domain-containing protein [Bacilli bacterium]
MIELKNICKSYHSNGIYEVALKNINLDLSSKGLISVVGKSGSGKTTLLNIIGSLDNSDFGELIVDGKNIREFSDNELDSYRNKYVSFIFQNYNLIDHMSVIDNIKLKMTISYDDENRVIYEAEEALKKVGLYKYKNKLPMYLSGGEKQRIAIARAISSDSKIILCDEPTGALDHKTGIEILNILKELSKEKLVIMVTHNIELAKKYSNRIITMEDGEIISDTGNKKIDDIIEDFKIPKIKMDIKTIIKIAYSNLKLKKKRNILLALTASIGIVGISIILSISNGFNDSLDEYEKYISNKVPVIISAYKQEKSNKKYSESKIININKDENSNYINKTFINYFNNINKEYVSSIKYNYLVKLNIINKDYYELDNSIFKTMPNNIKENYDLVEGRLPSRYDELLLEINTDNSFSSDISKSLNLKNNDALDTIINKEIKLVLNNDFYYRNEDSFNKKTIDKEMYDNKNNIKLKIVGIIKVKKEKVDEVTSDNSIYYMDTLVNQVISKNKNSDIVNEQKNKDYNLITREPLSEKEKKEFLCYLGSEKCISNILVYPDSFESKDNIIKLINKYNEDYVLNKVNIIDESKTLYDMSIKIINVITTVLVFFSSISLVVSSIMIGIITYISVLERKKEIGILRSMGVSKTNIKYLFICENIILGFISGITGILISIILSGPINLVTKELLESSDIYSMRLSDNILLILLSMGLGALGAYIPSKKASSENVIRSIENA